MSAMENENDLLRHSLNWIWTDDKGRVQIDEEGLRAHLAEGADLYIKRRDELIAALPRLPEIIDEDSNGKAADYVGQIMKCIKAAEAEREATKAPFLMATRLIDGFYHTVTDPLGNAKGRDTVNQLRAQVETKMTIYQRAKAERERQAREAERRRQEEEAARLRREAEEAERQRVAEAERLRREADELATSAITERDLNKAIEKESAAFELGAYPTPETKLADQAEADATRAQRDAEAPIAELSRTRSDLGATASLRRFIDFRDLDRATLDLETLRAHLPIDALEKAVRSFINAGGRELAGCEIFENTRTQVRA